ncbi:hypothetical protein ACX0G9_21405 [Flavitalea flava]
MCCGNKRNAFRSTQLESPGLSATHSSPGAISQLPFEYRGASGLTITGGVTGKKYQFARMGEVQLIDSRDRLSMSRLPVLKQLLAGKR